MRKILVAAILAACAAMPAQSAQIFTISLYGTLSGGGWIDNGTQEGETWQIGPYTTTMKLTGSWDLGFNSWRGPCNEEFCLKPHFEGNILRLAAADGALPCYCSETIQLVFDQPFNGELNLLGTDHLVTGSYSFSSGSHSGGEWLGGQIFGAAVPEPATWAMMIAGFGLAGGMLRRRSYRLAFA